uniref:Carboxylic ester hydrolase n=1 Tax=Acrobeloides nanus TaxID=290746 RepID=A0A914EI38_9BILA
MLGFFTTMTNDFPANLAMYDQIMAINFVRQEIGNFGGDPDKITLFGNSAGGSDVSAHTYSPLSQNLFHQAIMESGVAQMMIATDNSMSFNQAKTLCNYTKKMWNSKNFAALKQCLQSMDYQRFLALENFNVDWNMVVGDDFLPDYPENLWKKRKNIPVIIGTTKDEYAYDEMINLSSGDTKISGYDKAYFKNLLNIDFEYTDPELSQIANYLEKVYNDNKTISDTDHVGWFRTIANALTGALYTANARTEAKYYLQNNNPNVYLYEFAYFTKIGQVYDFGNAYKPVEHAKELYFIWMQDWEWPDDVDNGIVTPQDYAVADLMGATWTNFAKFGAPFVNQSWTPSKQATFDYFVINPKPEMKQNYRQFDDYVWNYVIPGYLNGDVSL